MLNCIQNEKKLNNYQQFEDIESKSDSENKNGYSTPIKVKADIEHIPKQKLEPPSMESLNRLSGGGCKDVDSPKLDDHNSIVDDLSYQSTADENFNIINELQQSYGSSTFYVSSPLVARLGGNKKTPTDRSYCLAKELLMTERTYRKDLEIINVIFREDFYKQFSVQCSAVEEVLRLINPLYERHCFLLRDLEQRLAFWEGKPVTLSQNGIKGVGDIFLSHKEMIQVHQTYLKSLPNILDLVQKELISDGGELANFYQHFESHKLCYLPVTSFLLRPAFRIPYYSTLLKNLLSVYDTLHEDFNFCADVLDCFRVYSENFEEKIIPLVNYVKLIELQRSLIGFSNLLSKKREFIREGCLLKFSRNGYHQHMFFLFSDIILYTSRVQNSQFRFKVQGQIPTLNLKVEETEPKHGVNNSFVLFSGEKRVTLSASSEKEHLKWLRDFTRIMQKTTNNHLNSSNSSSQIRNFTDDKYESSDDADDVNLYRDEKAISHHVNTSIHICWHRNISISSADLLVSLKHSISGYLLRKFKNNSGWQKLWVVLANLCLFFYKSYLDESPLASLPLAGYRITNTTNSDTVSGELIFKLQFKTHEYFFMAENKHTFTRWMETINYCTLAEEETTRL